MLKKKTLALFFILALALGLRLYKIKAPLADHHSWRQVDTAAIIRNLAQEDFDLLHPQWDNLVATNSQGLPNPNRYFFEDFPLAFDVYPALLSKVFGYSTTLLRFSSVAFSLLTIAFLFYLVSDLTGQKIALLTVLIYAVLPYSVFFSRGIFQEIPLNFYAVASLFFLQRYLKKNKNKYFLGAIVLNSLLFLTKPYALVFLLPEAWLFWQQDHLKIFKNKRTAIFFIASLLPFALWWLWVRRFPEGLPYSSWLFNEGNIRFKGSFFYWIFAERIGKLILGFYGLVFLGVGLLAFGRPEENLFYGWILALLVYVTVIAKGNVTHDYYQVPFLPPIAFFTAKGIDFLLSLPKRRFFPQIVTGVVVLAFSLFALTFSWYEVRHFYELKSGVDLAGVFVDQNLPPETLIISGDGADPTLLYNCNRRGWAVGYGSEYENNPETINKLVNKEAAFYVTTQVAQIRATGFYQYLKDNHSLLKETNQYVVFDLR